MILHRLGFAAVLGAVALATGCHCTKPTTSSYKPCPAPACVVAAPAPCATPACPTPVAVAPAGVAPAPVAVGVVPPPPAGFVR